jgi:hypothetical protein
MRIRTEISTINNVLNITQQPSKEIIYLEGEDVVKVMETLIPLLKLRTKNVLMEVKKMEFPIY